MHRYSSLRATRHPAGHRPREARAVTGAQGVTGGGEDGGRAGVSSVNTNTHLSLSDSKRNTQSKQEGSGACRAGVVSNDAPPS